MTPEERQQFLERMRARGFDTEALMARMNGPQGGQADSPAVSDTPQRRSSGDNSGGTQRSQRSQSQPAPAAASTASKNSSATTIDALFGPLPPTESVGQVWLYQGGKLSRVGLRLGITDGQQTELIQGNLTEGQDVVTSIVTAAQRAATNAGSTAFPGFQQNRGGFPGGGFPGGGGNRGGGGGRGGR